MPKAKAGFLTNLSQWEKTIETKPKTDQYIIFGVSFVLSVSIGILVAYSVRQMSGREIDQQKQEISSLERERMNERVEEFRRSL